MLVTISLGKGEGADEEVSEAELELALVVCVALWLDSALAVSVSVTVVVWGGEVDTTSSSWGGFGGENRDPATAAIPPTTRTTAKDRPTFMKFLLLFSLSSGAGCLL
jgi:hypothetical protein